MDKQRSFSISMRIALIPFILAGLALTAKGAYEVIRELQTRKWTIDVAKIISTSITTVRHGGNIPVVNYEYEHQGAVYSGSYRLTYFGQTYVEAKNILNSYQPETEIKIYINPRNANESVLPTGITSGSLLLLAIGATLSTIFALLFIFINKIAYLLGGPL